MAVAIYECARYPSAMASSEELKLLYQKGLQAEQSGQRAEAIMLYERVLQHEPFVLGLYPRLLTLKGLSATGDYATNWQLFEQVLLPALTRAAQHGITEQVLELEMFAYSTIAKQTETEANYYALFKAMEPHLELAGHKLNAALGALPARPPNLSNPRVGFFFHNATLLAHTEVILSTLKGLRAIDEGFTPVIYVLVSNNNPTSAEFNQAFASLGFDVYFITDHIPPANRTITNNFVALRHLMLQHQVDALVWVSLPCYLAFAAAAHIAPVLIWWSMRFPLQCFNHLDGRIGGGGLFDETRVVDGQLWRSIFLAYDNLTDPSQKPKADAIRAHYPDKFILGSIARTEKFMDDGFIQALATILKRNPDAVFLWTGREAYAPFVAALQREGITDQCHFIGWVDAKLYVQVFDLYIDSFPSGSGLTAMNAMAAGVPVVSTRNYLSNLGCLAYPAYHGLEGTLQDQQAIRSIFTDPASGKQTLNCAETTQDYIAMAQHLIDDAAYRKATGLSQQRFVADYLSSQPKLAARISKHIRDIIANPESRHATPSAD